ncbi:MAG: threonylcarbamoyl-AMP synthase [Phycisphaerae bacterium]|nr:threonylcarbamoyl-AMP synthase [Gemmatimonadaceae bacterium]
MLVAVDAQNPDSEVILRAAEILRRGGLVAFPTETVYGLGANALDATAVARIFEAKARPAWNPVIAHVSNAEDARRLTTFWPESATQLAMAFWPGPLTLVLPKADIVPDIVSAGMRSVALRVPSHAVARALIAAAGFPIAAPSANRFTQLSPTTAAHVEAGLGERVDLILDGGRSDVGIESTVVDLTNDDPVILRPGVISRDTIMRVLGVSVAVASKPEAGDAPRLSPGMMDRHYAPRADVWLFDSSNMNELRQSTSQRPEASVAALVLDWSLSLPDTVRAIPMPNDPLAYARALYATLHDLDLASYAIVAIERPPVTDAWAGVHDRLSRAAH